MKYKKLYFGLASIALLLISACQPVNLRGSLIENKFPLLGTQIYTASSLCLLNVKMQSGDIINHYQFIYDATSDPHKLLVLSPVGQRLVTVLQKGDRVSMQKSLPVSLMYPAQELLVAMQLIYWPVAVLEKEFQNSEWSITASDSARYVFKGSDLLAKIVYQGSGECSGIIEYTLNKGEMLHIESVPY
ncbi:MAG: DUF3261 domain-containing protein [Gammaproteobacteria bacterium]|nr:DUF3261 domain-containing protein [Gammaproteobacteria bacterium]